jgi:hypothetical protein
MVEEKKEFNTESIGDTEITEKRKKKDKSNAVTRSAQRKRGEDCEYRKNKKAGSFALLPMMCRLDSGY